MPSPRQWWRRAKAAAKDKRSLYLTRISVRNSLGSSDMESAVIRATSHDERSLDYKNAGHVFALARASPSLLHPLMWTLARRATRTKSWPVALKSLLLAHGLVLLSSPPFGRLPFDLSDFQSRRSPHFSAFVRAYFAFLDHRSLFLISPRTDHDELARVEKLQSLLDLLMQIRPFADEMEVGLILEAMDCAMVEIFEVYSGICNGIACFLVGFMGEGDSSVKEERRRKGMLGIRVLRRAAAQSLQLSAYFELCRRMRVLNAEKLPAVESIPEEDITDLEKLVMGQREEIEGGVERMGTVMTMEWVVFDDDTEERKGCSVNLTNTTKDDLIELM